MAEDAPTDDELRQWLEDDPYNSILMRRRFPRVVQALLAERADKPVELRTFPPKIADWCGPDDCPIEICNGPHVEHPCIGGDTATTRIDQLPCILCGHTYGGSA